MRRVRHIEPENIDSGLDQPPDHFGGFRGWSQSRDDLCPAHYQESRTKQDCCAPSTLFLFLLIVILILILNLFLNRPPLSLLLAGLPAVSRSIARSVGARTFQSFQSAAT